MKKKRKNRAAETAAALVLPSARPSNAGDCSLALRLEMVDHVANAGAAAAASRWFGSSRSSCSSAERTAPLLPEAPPAGRGPPASLSRYHVLVAVQSSAFFLAFAAFNAAQSLNGSIRAPPGLAPIQFMSIYIVFAAFAIPAPKLISCIGAKPCMALGMSPYVGLTLSFLAPPYCTGDGADDDDGTCWSVATIWALRIGTGVLLGLGAPILWTGQGVYLARLAAHEARRAPVAPSSGQHDGAATGAAAGSSGTEAVRAEQLSQTLKRFNGIFFSVFQLSGATGLVGSSLLLTFVKSSSATTYLFIGLSVLTGAGLLCVVLCLPALPPVDDDAADDAEGGAVAVNGSSPAKPKAEGKNVTILATLHLCADPRMLLVVPNIAYNGLSLGFIWCASTLLLYRAPFRVVMPLPAGAHGPPSPLLLPAAGTCTTPSSSTRRSARRSSASAARRATSPTRSRRRR